MRTVIALLMFSSLSLAGDQAFRLVNPATPRGMQEIATILRTVGDVPDLKIDAEKMSIDVSGTDAQLAFSDWVFHQVDRPAGWTPTEQERKNPATREYQGLKEVTRAFYLTNTPEPRQIQETLTILRTVLDVNRIFNYSETHTLIYRGPAAQLDAVEWLLKILDAPAGTAVPAAPWKLDSKPFDLARVFALPKDISPKAVQELITQLRIQDHVMKVFTRTAPPLLVEAGTAALLDQTAKRIAALP